MFGERGLEQQLMDARAALSKARAATARAEPQEIETDAAEGRIKVILGADGRISAIDLDPRVLREGVEYLSSELRNAVNAALDDQDADPSAGEPVPDLDALHATIEQLQDQSMRQMREMNLAIGEVMRKLHRS
ncbi:MAG TPA: YbaB/EbfC family nucleoid-associated protein [Micromonosporaceae bacterium]|nr:YbaB/EbfC family nucleoid-associated protein [Micromonosporaceae bacterium]